MGESGVIEALAIIGHEEGNEEVIDTSTTPTTTSPLTAPPGPADGGNSD